MQNRLVIFVSGAVLALGACGRHDEATDNTAADMNVAIDNGVVVDNGMVANDAAVAPSPLTAQGFANTAAASDRFEIESSKLAEASASSAAVKKFAAQMIKAGTANKGMVAKLEACRAALRKGVGDVLIANGREVKLDALAAAKGPLAGCTQVVR